MRIAQIASISVRVPPKKYGGTERVIHALTEELVKRGHDVTLFASGDSITSAKLVAIYPKPLTEVRFENAYGSNILTQFDIIHDHNGFLSLPTANMSTTPVVMTLHGAIGVNEKRIYENLKKPYLVSISHAQAEPAPNLNYIANIYHGLPMNHYPFSRKHDGYLLFVGRISMEKGLHHAIAVAQYLDLPLIIAAKLNNIADAPHDVEYFKTYIEPKLSDSIQWVGEVNDEEKTQLMSKALCLLHPVTWPEPFGLTMIEAMACGCPVVGFNLGSIPEIINHGKTGFVVKNAEEMIEAVTFVKNIDRQRCRDYVLTRFTVEEMANGYEKAYREILKIRQSTKPSSRNLKNLSQNTRNHFFRP